MKALPFFKFQGTGNDFIMIDNRQGVIDASNHALIIQLCDRKFGIGADGLILIQKHPDCDFEMIYFNADATKSMCGNGSRCAVRFAHQLGIIDQHCIFMAFDGLHQATVDGHEVKLKMGNVSHVQHLDGGDFFANTGSPHHVRLVEKIKDFPVYEEGKFIRNKEAYKKAGTNVNFVELQPNNTIFVRTYERGVEAETLSCGTGVTASALVASHRGYSSPVQVKTLGGNLEVSFQKSEDGGFREVYLSGPAMEVYEGSIRV